MDHLVEQLRRLATIYGKHPTWGVSPVDALYIVAGGTSESAGEADALMEGILKLGSQNRFWSHSLIP